MFVWTVLVYETKKNVLHRMNLIVASKHKKVIKGEH